MRRFMRILLCGAAACAVFGALAAEAAASARVKVGRAPSLPTGARLTGSVPASTQVQLSIALKSRDPAALRAFATAVSTPGSPQFRHFLSVAQFSQRFGATDAQIAGVQSALRSEGLTVSAPTANHLTLRASGTTAAVQRVFGTRLSHVTLRNGRTAYADTSAPTLPSAVGAHIQGVVGLNNLVTAHPEALARARSLAPAGQGSVANVATGGPQPCAAATAAAAGMGYTADLISAAYGFSSLYGAGDRGAGQTIAVYELEPYNAADVAAYQACYGTTTSVTNVAVDNPPAFASGDDDEEAALDIEQLIGLAPAARIIVYQAPNTAAGAVDEYSTIVSQDKAKVVTSSWGDCEAALLGADPTAAQSENTLLEEAAAQGQSVYVAAGDTGSAACAQSSSSDTGLSVQDPAAQPFATGVGGTTLFTGSLSAASLWAPGSPVQQSVWNDGTLLSASGAATGGGISSVWAMPSYQSGAAASVGVINANSSSAPCGQAPFCREVPDVSADGDPATGYPVFADGAWEVAGGTSAAAPLWAAFTALVNADSRCRGQVVGFVNPALYRLAGTAYASNFSDVTLASPITGEANNDALGVNGGLYPVTAGYDMATGLGTPVAPTLAASLCALASPLYSVAVSNPGSQSGRVGRAQALQIHATDSGGVAVTYAATGLPAGLEINPLTGLISGKPTTAVVAAVTVSATDRFTNAGAIHFSWTIAGHPRIASVKLTGLAHHRPKLTFVVTAGVHAPALKAISIKLPSGLVFGGRLKRGISVTAKFKARLHAGVLTLSLRKRVRRATVRLAGPTLRVSGKLAAKARRHRLGKLKLRIGTKDAANTSFSAALKVKDKD